MIRSHNGQMTSQQQQHQQNSQNLQNSKTWIPPVETEAVGQLIKNRMDQLKKPRIDSAAMKNFQPRRQFVLEKIATDGNGKVQLVNRVVPPHGMNNIERFQQMQRQNQQNPQFQQSYHHPQTHQNVVTSSSQPHPSFQSVQWIRPINTNYQLISGQKSNGTMVGQVVNSNLRQKVHNQGHGAMASQVRGFNEQMTQPPLSAAPPSRRRRAGNNKQASQNYSTPPTTTNYESSLDDLIGYRLPDSQNYSTQNQSIIYQNVDGVAQATNYTKSVDQQCGGYSNPAVNCSNPGSDGYSNPAVIYSNPGSIDDSSSDGYSNSSTSPPHSIIYSNPGSGISIQDQIGGGGKMDSNRLAGHNLMRKEQLVQHAQYHPQNMGMKSNQIAQPDIITLPPPPPCRQVQFRKRVSPVAAAGVSSIQSHRVVDSDIQIISPPQPSIRQANVKKTSSTRNTNRKRPAPIQNHQNPSICVAPVTEKTVRRVKKARIDTADLINFAMFDAGIQVADVPNFNETRITGNPLSTKNRLISSKIGKSKNGKLPDIVGEIGGFEIKVIRSNYESSRLF